MSYVLPSVLVYQQLAANAGVSNITPDLDSCIIGPCYNVVTYDTTSASTLLTSWATDSTGNNKITLAGDVVAVDAYVPSPTIGQLVDATSIVVYLNNSQVQSGQTKYVSHSGGTGGYAPNEMSINPLSGVQVSIVNNSKNITVTAGSPTLFINDVVTIAGAGPNDTDLTATVVTITDSTHFVISANAKVGIAGATGLAMTRVAYNNFNSDSSTLRVEVGDIVQVVSGAGAIFSSTILTVTAPNNYISKFSMADNLPSSYTSGSTYTVNFIKKYNNLLLPVTYKTYTNYNTTNVTTAGSISIQVAPQVSYGIVVAGEVHIQYRALRQDLLNRIIEVDTIDDIEGTVGVISDQNPVALALELAHANTTGRMLCITIPSDDLAGYLTALDLSASMRMYTLVPLTQDLTILEAFQQHVDQLSTPEKASWRVALVNSAIPTTISIGQYNANNLNVNGGNNTTTTGGLLTSSNSTFISDGVVPGDILVSVNGGVTTTYVIASVISNQLLQLAGTVPATTGFGLYVKRNLTKVQQAAAVAATSTTFSDRRILHIQPDSVGVSVGGVVKYLPGFYLCAAISGLMSGLPAQQGLTYIGIAGISDLLHSNFYFTRAQMDTMAAAGTFLVAQQSQGNIPYVRHSLTTDMTVLQYREIQQVKNIDFLSYYFYDKLQGFAGRYNITPDTLQILRTTVQAGAENLKKKVLPKIGPPLLSYQIKTLAQDAFNQDQVNIELPVKIPTVMNYINLYLIV